MLFDTQKVTRAPAKNSIKNKLKSCFVDLFGEQHKDKITQRIDNMNINRCFQVLGTKNSISQFLIDEKTRIFNEGHKHKFSNPQDLWHYATTPVPEILDEAKNAIDSAMSRG